MVVNFKLPWEIVDKIELWGGVKKITLPEEEQSLGSKFIGTSGAMNF